MAVDEAIARAFSRGEAPPTLRFYRWRRPTFSLGAFQRLEQVFVERLQGAGIPLVRRITGGRGLLHADELTYAVVACPGDPRFSGGIRGTFQAVSAGLLAGLARLGVSATVYLPSREIRPDRRRDPLCFAAPARFEITAGGKKLIGSAQRRWPDAFLQHGALMRSRPGSAPSLPPEAAALIPGRQAALSDLLPVLPEYGRIVQALKVGFETALGIRLSPGGLSSAENSDAARLVREKYGHPRWTFHRETGAG